MAAWPSSLPCQPLAGGFQFVPEVNVAEFKPDVGAPIRRRRYTGRRQLYNAEMALNSVQVADLMDFFFNDCADGVFTFTMEDWRTKELLTYSWISPPNINRVAPNIWRAGIQIALEPVAIAEIFDIFQGGLSAGGRDGIWYDISNLATLFQASDGSTPVVADNNPVGYIADSSGNGNQAQRLTSDARRANYRTSGGLHWLQFDGVDDCYNIPAGIEILQNVGEAHLFAAIEIADNAADKYIFSNSTGTSATNPRAALRASSTEQFIFAARRGDADATSTNTGPIMALATPHVLSVKLDWNKADAFGRRNGAFEISNISFLTAGLTANTPSLSCQLGALNGTLPYLGKIYQFMLVVGSLSDVEIKQTEQFLAGKCGAVF